MTRHEACPPPAEPDAVPAAQQRSRGELVEALFREHNQGLVRFLAARLSSDAEAKEVAQGAYVPEVPGRSHISRKLL